MKKRDLLIYRIATGIFTALMLMGVSRYIFEFEMVKEMVLSLNYPPHIIYPLGVAKTLALVAIWTNKSKILKEWAYAGLTYVFLLAMAGHLNAGDGGFYGPLMALTILAVSYIFYRRLENSKAEG